LKTLEFHMLDTGHFALEEDGDRIATLMRGLLRKHVAKKKIVRWTSNRI
jgi:hypothetical protein